MKRADVRASGALTMIQKRLSRSEPHKPSSCMSMKLTPDLREQLLVALTNQWASMVDDMDEGDFTPDDFYEIRKNDSDEGLIEESGCETQAQLDRFIDDWFYSGFWTSG